MKPATNKIQISILLILLLAALLSSIKMVFFGLNIDEEYTVTLGYRIITADKMFLDMWEPHQMSGFVCAFFTKIFMLITGSTDYLVVYLRIISLLIHGCISAYLHTALSKITTKYLSAILSVLSFIIVPKMALSIDFSLIAYLSLVIITATLIKMEASAKQAGYVIILSLATCALILSYPSMLLLFIGLFITLFITFSKKDAFLYAGACFIIGLLYVGYFTLTLGLKNFLFGIQQMMTDGEHSASVFSTLFSNIKSWLIVLVSFAVLYALAFLIAKIFKVKKQKDFIAVSISLVALIGQLVYWLSSFRYINYPLVLYYLVFGALLTTRRITKQEFLKFVLPSLIATFSGALLTNTGIYVISVMLIPAIIYLLTKTADTETNATTSNKIIIYALLLIFLFSRGWLVCESGSFKADMTYVKQKALSGPAKGIYCRYIEGYQYNQVQALADQYIESDASVLCISGHTLWYLLSDYQIANYSTISTPTYDERLLEYYDLYPDKKPDYILVDAGIDTTSFNDIFDDYIMLETVEYVTLYKHK
ncbi:MAG: hypothetical protein IJ397_07150 [Lachnospiraceae bacterium]|nr:hypothetical protein [Lachnospiraceae bacterium]